MGKGNDYEMRRKQASARRRLAVLAGAGQCFAELGYKKTTMEEVSRRAEVSKGLVFHFFGSKQKLFRAVVEDSLNQWSTLSEYRASGAEGNTLAELRSLFLTSFDFKEHNPVLMLFARDEEALLQTYLPEVTRQNRRWRARIRRTLKQGVENGEIRSIDVQRVSVIFHQLQIALLARRVPTDPLPHYDRKTVQLAIELFLRGIQAIDQKPI
ncbi:MAG: TetR/AcrR family transcriptional regulator [Pseudomonadales bacterium]